MLQAVTEPWTPNSPPEMPISTLSPITIGALVPVSPFLGIAVGRGPDHLAGLRVERHQGGVGLDGILPSA